MSAKHTTGAVVVEPGYEVTRDGRVFSVETMHVAFIATSLTPSPRAEADARLMAAAPDLLAACRRILVEDGGCSCSEGYCAWCLASAAIAKAEGRS